MNSLQGTRDLHNITPKNVLGDMQAEGTGIARWMRKVSLSEGFGERVVVGDKDQRAVAKTGVGKSQMNSDHVTAFYFFPICLHISDSCLIRFVRQVIACWAISVSQRRSHRSVP